MPSLSPAERKMRDAIDALPEPTRTIYRAHLLHDLDYEAIGAGAGLGVREVERHVAEAIILIDRHLRGSAEDCE